MLLYTKSELHFSKFMSSSVPFLWIFRHFLWFLQIWANFKILYRSEFLIFFDETELCCTWHIGLQLSQFTIPYLHPKGTKVAFFNFWIMQKIHFYVPVGCLILYMTIYLDVTCNIFRRRVKTSKNHCCRLFQTPAIFGEKR